MLRVVAVLRLAGALLAARRVVVLLPQVATVPRVVAEAVGEEVAAVDEGRRHQLYSTE